MPECGPDNCPIIDSRANRKAKAKKLDEQGFSQAQIAAFLGVSQQQISKDLLSLQLSSKLPPRTSKRGRKGEGRPRGSRKAKSKPKQEKVQDKVDTLVREGKPVSRKSLSDEFDVGPHTIQVAHAFARGKFEAEPTIIPDMLSLTAQQKLDTAMRQHARMLDQEFDSRVLKEVERRMDCIVLPAWKETIDWAEAVRKREKGILTESEYTLLRSCLHPDRVQDNNLKRKFTDAFGILERLKKFLCGPEKEPSAKFPRTWQEAQSSTSEKVNINGPRV